MDAIVELRNVSKAYRGINALANVDFALERGEVHAVLGENGAGKSTLTKIIAGAVEPSSGTVLMNGSAVRFGSPAEASRAGIGMVFQETSLIPSMTVAQNLFLGDEKLLNRIRGIQIEAQQFLQSLNFQVDPGAMVQALGAAQKQMVEIARSVRRDAKVIIFDEPTATLTPEEKQHFFLLIERLKQRGISIVFISHALEEAIRIADRITVLRDGRHVVTDAKSAFDRARIVRAMVGRDLTDTLYRGDTELRVVRRRGTKVLSVEDLRFGKVVRNNSFSIFAGQITGIFGLVGSGRTETAKIIAGVIKRDYFQGGEVRLDSKTVRYRVPRSAIKDGIVYVTEDRKQEGFFESQSIAGNLYAGLLSAGLENENLVSRREMRALSQTWTKSLNIKSIDPGAKVVELSGGNQQKVVIGKALVQKPRIVIMDEPTRGVDVGAIAEIHRIMQNLADSGIAVMMISSYLPEILSISDRILVCRQGRIVEEFSPRDATEDKIMYAAVH